MDKEQLLYRFFSNELTPEQKEQFNALLTADPEFKEQFDFEKNLQNVIRDKEANDLRKKLVGFEKDISKETPVKKLRANYQKWAMAASIALLVALGWIGYTNFSGPNYGSLYESNFQQYPNTVYTITRGDTIESLERKAFSAYELGDYESAATLFLKSEDDERIEHSDFYLAQSYLNLDRTDDAITLLAKVIKEDDKFKAEANWYLALTYLKLEDKKNTVVVLQRQIENYDFNKSKAMALLGELD